MTKLTNKPRPAASDTAGEFDELIVESAALAANPLPVVESEADLMRKTIEVQLAKWFTEGYVKTRG